MRLITFFICVFFCSDLTAQKFELYLSDIAGAATVHENETILFQQPLNIEYSITFDFLSDEISILEGYVKTNPQTLTNSLGTLELDGINISFHEEFNYSLETGICGEFVSLRSPPIEIPIVNSEIRGSWNSKDFSGTLVNTFFRTPVDVHLGILSQTMDEITLGFCNPDFFTLPIFSYVYGEDVFLEQDIELIFALFDHSGVGLWHDLTSMESILEDATLDELDFLIDNNTVTEPSALILILFTFLLHKIKDK